MNKNTLKTMLLTFLGLWLLYFIIEFFSGTITSSEDFLINLIFPSLFMIISAFLFSFISYLHAEKFKTSTVLSTIIIFISLDQFIKFLIRTFFVSGKSIELLLNWLFFYPVLNTSGSWAASRFGINLGVVSFTLINFISLLFIIQIYRFYKSRSSSNALIDISFILILSGAVCSFIDKLFFGGSLDYLSVGNLFVADLKDFYLTLSMGLLITSFSTESPKDPQNNNDLRLIKDFLLFNFKNKT